MDAVMRDRLSLIAALGAGVVMGISGIYLYYKANRCVTKELSHLTGTIESLRKEIEELKCNARISKDKKSHSDRSKHNSNSSLAVNRCFTGYTSSVEDNDEEYFDFTDTEDVGVWSAINGSLAYSSSSDSEDKLDDLDALLDMDSSDKEALYYMLTSKIERNLENVEYLWRLAKATHLYGIVLQNRGEPDKRKELAFEASSYAKMAYDLDKEHPEVHKWCAITVGSLGDFVGPQDRIINGYTFKEHVDKAISLKPSDPTLHYMLGRWCYEVASLSWLERKLASTLFSTPPMATLDEARCHLDKANELKPDWKENILFKAKTFIGDGDYSNAISLIDSAIELPCTREDDELAHKELELLQYKYQTYRNEQP